MGSSEKTVVRTALTPEEYERFRSIAEREGLTLEEALRTAAKEYVGTREEPDPDDPFFAYEPPAIETEPVSATRTDEYLYGGD